MRNDPLEDKATERLDRENRIAAALNWKDDKKRYLDAIEAEAELGECPICNGWAIEIEDGHMWCSTCGAMRW